MASNDLRDIMGLEKPMGVSAQELTKEMLLSADKPRKSQGRRSEPVRRPEGMARELYNLLYNDSKDAPPVIPTDTPIGGGKKPV
jgi:DNA methyltransferase 1-associated protein 1